MGPKTTSHILLTDSGEHISKYCNAFCLLQKISFRHFLKNPNQLHFECQTLTNIKTT